MEIAALSPSRYSSLEKKSKLESIGFRPSCEGFFVGDELHTVCQEGAALLVSFVFFGEELDWLVVWLLWPELARGLVLLALPLQSVRPCQFLSVFPLSVPSLASSPDTPTSSTGFPSSPPPFWTSLAASCSSFTSLEFCWLTSKKDGLHLGEDECEEEEEECWECRDNGEEDRSEWWVWARGGLPERFWTLCDRPRDWFWCWCCCCWCCCCFWGCCL